MKYFILLGFLFTILCSQSLDSTRLNKKPKMGVTFEIADSAEFSQFMLQPMAYISINEIVIADNGKTRLSVDGFGNFIIGKNDTVAQSCKLMETFKFVFDSLVVSKTPTTDSAYYYKQQVEFYRQWFKKNDTPNPLMPKPQFRAN